MMRAMPDAAPRERLFFADWLRIGAFALLVVYHVGMVYVPWDYHLKHQPTYPALEPWMRLSNPWRMSLLFVVSGLAAGLMPGRPGLARTRAKRLLLPLLFGMVVVVPPQAWWQVRDQFGYTGGYIDFLRLYFSGYAGFCKGTDCLRLPTWNHLWFLPYLWVYTALLLVVLRWVPRRALERAATALAGLNAGPVLLLLPVLYLGGVRALLLPRFGETHALLGDWWAHATYAPMFASGVLLARRQALLAGLEALRWPALACAAAAWCALVAGTADWPRLPLRFAFAAEQWCAIVAAFGFARRHLNADHRWRAPLTEAVFPLYLVHQTLILGGFVLLRPLALPVGAEALLLVLFAFGGGFVAWRGARGVAALRPWMGIGRPAPAA